MSFGTNTVCMKLNLHAVDIIHEITVGYNITVAGIEWNAH